MFAQYCHAQIYVHAKKPLDGAAVLDKRRLNKGRPRTLSSQDQRSVTCSLRKLRSTDVSFTSRHIQLSAGLHHVSNRTVRRCMNNAGYQHLQSRKKGRLIPSDLKKRVAFCRQQLSQQRGEEFQATGISFSLNGKGFEFKTNPIDQARAPKRRKWRK